MDVRVQGQFQPQAELMDQREVAFRSLGDRIDECAFPRFLTAEQISVGGGLRLEELPKDHRQLHPFQGCPASRARSATGSPRSESVGSSAPPPLAGVARLAPIRSRYDSATWKWARAEAAREGEGGGRRSRTRW